MKQSGSDVHVIELAFEHVENILAHIWLFYLTVTCLNVADGEQLTKLAVTFADVDVGYWNLMIFAIRCYIVGAEFG